MNDIEFAKDKVIMGSERKSLVINEHERKVTAYHEAGHALVAKLTPGTDPVHKVTIIPRGMALGLTMQIPIEDKYMMSRDYLLKTINILLAGRAAEEIIFNERTTGAGNDLERASEIARKMVTEWGMSEKVGPIRLTKKEGEVFLGKEMSTGSQLSPTTSEIIDSEIKSIIVNANNEAVNLLKENEKFLHDLANLLLEQEVVDSKELNKLLGIEEEVKSPSNNNEQEKASNWSPITPETTTAFSEIED